MREVPRLLVVTEPALMGTDPVDAVRGLFESAESGVSAKSREPVRAAERPEESAKPGPNEGPPLPGRWMLQWRDKASSPKETYTHLVSLGVVRDAPIVVNDRVDLALALGYGVHLTESSLPTRIARSLLPSDRLVGRSTHDLRSALRAEAEGADYVVFGPVFDTPSKRAYGPPAGLGALAEVARTVRVPVLAIGGIGPSEIPECLHAGAHGAGVIRAIWSAPSPHLALSELLSLLGN